MPPSQRMPRALTRDCASASSSCAGRARRRGARFHGRPRRDFHLPFTPRSELVQRGFVSIQLDFFVHHLTVFQRFGLPSVLRERFALDAAKFGRLFDPLVDLGLGRRVEHDGRLAPLRCWSTSTDDEAFLSGRLGVRSWARRFVIECRSTPPRSPRSRLTATRAWELPALPLLRRRCLLNMATSIASSRHPSVGVVLPLKQVRCRAHTGRARAPARFRPIGAIPNIPGAFCSGTRREWSVPRAAMLERERPIPQARTKVEESTNPFHGSRLSRIKESPHVPASDVQELR